MFQRFLLSDSDVEHIRDGALQVLESAGMMFQSERLLRALEAKGAAVDWPHEVARIPRRLVSEVIDAESRTGAAFEDPGLIKPGLPTVTGQAAPLLYEHEGRRVRRPGREDFITLVKFGEALHSDAGVGHVVLMADVPQPLKPLVAQAILIEHIQNPQGACLYYAEQIEYAMEMGRIYCGDATRFCGRAVCLVSPLRFAQRACEYMARKVELGLRAHVNTMPVAGVSAPATVAGAIVVVAAEILGAWTAFRAIRDDVPLGAGIAAGAVDMRTGNVSFCSPDAMKINFGVVEFFRRVCRKEIPVAGSGEYCDAKAPGLRAAIEKAHKSMTVAAFTGTQMQPAEGMVDSGKVFSPEQLLIERDLQTGRERLFRPIDVNDETLALDRILEIGQGVDKTHLETAHTLKHYRVALWSPTFHDLDPAVGDDVDFDVERRLLDKAHELYKQTLSQYTPPHIDEDKVRAVWQVVDRAQRHLIQLAPSF